MPSFWKQNRKPILIGLLLLLLLAGLGWLGLRTIGLVSMERHEGYFAPALSPDGRSVWFFQRTASGLAVGLGAFLPAGPGLSAPGRTHPVPL